VVSPLSIMAGAAIPPIAPLALALELALVVDEAAEEVAVLLALEVEFENGAESTAAFVASGASTVTVPVTMEQSDTLELAALATTAGAVVCACAPEDATAA
jgi:hypothetical protein